MSLSAVCERTRGSDSWPAKALQYVGNRFIDHSSFETYSDVLKTAKVCDILAIDRGCYIHYVFVAEIDESTKELICYHIQKEDKYDGQEDNALIYKQPLKAILADNSENREIFTIDEDPDVPENAVLSKVKVHNQTEHATKHSLTPRDSFELYQVLMELERLVMHKEPVPYHLKNFNCEHYVTCWKYGFKWSSQTQFSWFAKPMETMQRIGFFPHDWQDFSPEEFDKYSVIRQRFPVRWATQFRCTKLLLLTFFRLN